MAIADNIKNVNRIARDPDALYASALGALHLSPAVQAVLSPVGKAVFEAGYAVASRLAGQAVSDLGSSMLDAAASVISEGTLKAAEGIASSVAGTVSEAMPLIGIAVDMVMVIASVGAANTALAESYQQQAVHDFLAGANAPGSGPGGHVTPSDIFSPMTAAYQIDPSQREGGYAVSDGWWWYRPYQPVGACLVAITEDSWVWGDTAPSVEMSSSDGNTSYGLQPPSPDNNLLHNRAVLDGFVNDEFQKLVPGSGHMGPSQERRQLYRNLRMAIGSHSESDSHGSALYTIYMDMLADDFDSGRLTAGWALFVLTNVYVPGAGLVPANMLLSNLPSDFQGRFRPAAPCTPEQFSNIVDQITAMVTSWKKERAKAKSSMHLTFNLSPTDLVRIAEKTPFGPDLVHALRTFTPAVRSSVLIAAYRKSLAKPPFRPNLFPGLAAHLFKK